MLKARTIYRTAGLALAVLPLLSNADDNPLDAVQKSATELARVRSETARLESEWRTQRELLDSTARALEQRAATAEEKRDDLSARTADERRQIAAVDAKNKATSESLQAAESRLKQMESQLVQVRHTLPPRLSAALEMAFRSLADPALPAGDRMQLTMTILNRCLQFDRTVSYGKETIDLGAGAPRKLLEVIYWGLARGYALDRTTGTAWLGIPGPDGWQWIPHPEAAKSVAALIATYNDKADPAYQVVPARLAHVTPEPAR